jgi:hypothetical protein
MFLFLLYCFLAYMAYQLVFKFILPIYRTTRQMRRSFRDMQERMNGNQAGQPFSKAQPQKQEPVGDYIDFEEVRDK